MKRWILWAMPVTLLAQSGASPGSLFVPGGRFTDSTRDFRASAVGDIVTILVNDTASALAQGVTNTSRKTAATSNVNSIAGISDPHLSGLLNIAGNQQLQGQGQTSRNMTITTTLSARVIQTTPNGSLLVEGLKDLGVNSEKQKIVVRGLIRPEDLSAANTINSNQMANLTIQVDGKGVVGDAVRRPHFLYRLLLGVLPF